MILFFWQVAMVNDGMGAPLMMACKICPVFAFHHLTLKAPTLLNLLSGAEYCLKE